jgi:hypothetical protein
MSDLLVENSDTITLESSDDLIESAFLLKLFESSELSNIEKILEKL